jgi:hypothetical protein
MVLIIRTFGQFVTFSRYLSEYLIPLIDPVDPVSQARFRKNCSCTEQVLALTSQIEAGFQRKLKTDVIFIDLTAAYDTV